MEAQELDHIPSHVAIIMDGNRRWAKKKDLPLFAGHLAGADRLTQIVEDASDLGIKILTVFAFSTENWQRPLEEVSVLFELLESYLKGETPAMIKKGVRLGVVGDIKKFPERLIRVIEETCLATSSGSKMDLVLALNYGGRDEIRRAAVQIVDACMEGHIKREEITEQTVAQFLDTAKWADPELLIRTSGEVRLSNFLLWQLSYAEMYVTDVLWPDFTKKDLVAALCHYQQRQRRLGR